MKKIFSGILVLLLAVTMFADSREVVDGVIEVAESGKFPTGHFGQAAGYLPGDSVFVTNPESGVTLQFLNLGTLDSADGIVILLSDESAKTLGIEKGSGMRCKLNMRYGGFDETVIGQAVIDAEDAALAKKTRNLEKPRTVESPAETPAVVEEVEAPSVVEALPAVAAAPVAGVPLFENDEEPAEETAEEEIIAEEVEEEESASEETVAEEPMEEIAETSSIEEPVEEEVVAEEILEEPVAPVVAAAPVVEPVEEEAVEEELVEDYEDENAAFAETRSAVEQPSPADMSEAEELAAVEEAVAEDEIAPVAEIVAVEAVEEEELPPVAEAVEEEELPALVEDKEEAVAVEPVEEVMEESTSEEVAEESVEDEYAPIVLVPAEPVAPEAVEEEVLEPVEVAASTRAVESLPVEEPEVVVEPEPVVVAPAPVVSSKTYESLIVDSEDSLKKGCWYVQIASLGNPENLEKTVKKYSKYPIVLVPNGKGAYRVLVGPLGVDEYAAVLAKFKAFGYKDAFLKRK
ncbi:SPOR domain-containing protein [Treponema sp.]|uniref:SPOR domain-containing protein n=1 Tax=Treponema sp. TaxID=166 RepID=UPI0038902BA6